MINGISVFSSYFLQRIPKWWIWLYYMTPTSWVMNGILTSQYGDMHMEFSAFGETKKISAFIEDYFGYGHDFLGVVAVVLLIYPVIVACLLAYLIWKLNFQRRWDIILLYNHYISCQHHLIKNNNRKCFSVMINTRSLQETSSILTLHLNICDSYYIYQFKST